jgi:PAS domain S-box-containing protein
MLLHSIRSRLLGLVLATVIPFTGLIGFGLWNQWRNDQAASAQRALDEARLLAAQVDDHIGNLENLLAGLSAAVSTNSADTSANDALLRQARSELPDFIASILLFSLDGSNNGRSGDLGTARTNASNRAYFQQVLAGQRLSVGEAIRGIPRGRWVVTVARPIEDKEGRLRAVLAVGTLLDHFPDALRMQRLPAGSLVEIIDEKGVGIARSADGLDWIGRDLSKVEFIARHIAAKEISEITRWSDDVERITGSSTAHKVPWLVLVGLPTDIAFATLASHLIWSALVIAGTLMTVFAIAWTLSGHIVRPLRQLGKDASTLAAGELSHRTAVRTHDEVGALADNFNRMAESLERRQDEARCSADELRQAKDTLATVIDASPVAIVCTDRDRRIFLWSRAAEEIFGYTAEEAVGQRSDLLPPKSGDQSTQLFERAINGETLRNMRLKKRRKDGSLINVRAAAAPMYNPDGSVRGIARAYEDITNYMRAEAQLERVAHYDQLTGLPNRLSLQKELGRRLSGEGCERPTAIVLFDLDGFKDVNDTLGHSVGDQLLVEVGQRLAEIAGTSRAVCRLVATSSS